MKNIHTQKVKEDQSISSKNGISCEEVDQPSMVWGVIREVLRQHHNQQPVHNEDEIDLLKVVSLII